MKSVEQSGSKEPEAVLGVWDGHDAGAALVRGDRVVAAINEERLTRRKLEVGFPSRSIRAVLEQAGMKPGDVRHVAATTSDFAKTLTRVVPSLKEQYYQLRRKKRLPGALYGLKKMLKYRLTEIPPSAPTRFISSRYLKACLESEGINADLSLVDHHSAHAATAAFSSGFDRATVVSLDGIGDGLSGGVWHFHDSTLDEVAAFDGRTSFGIFFEHVANIMNLRELEDEGKVMALANYAYPVPDQDNPLLGFFEVSGCEIRTRYNSVRMHGELRKVFWKFPLEQFAFMAQRTLEVKVTELIRAAILRTSEPRLAYAGGVASNIKINLLLRESSDVERLFVFPHMGDGGQALGAAMWLNQKLAKVARYRMEDVYWGPRFSVSDVRDAVAAYPDLRIEEISDPAAKGAELIASGEIIFWFQGRMEYGPRALGGRSILARADSLAVKDALNMTLKKRVWYQPFCPSMLEEEAEDILIDYKADRNPFMTCGYRVRPDKRDIVQGAMGVDGTCRPQVLRGDEPHAYARLLRALKERSGRGVVLNTSLNLHGEPMVCSPADVLRTFQRTDVNFLIAENLLISKASRPVPSGV